jgi:O-antigen/teichoic acid export membrane protein
MSSLVGEPAKDHQTKPLSLRLNFSWTLAGNLAYAATQWALIAAIAKLGTAAMVGQFSLALAITAPVFMLTALNLRAIQATDIKNEFGFRDYARLRIGTVVIALLAIAAILAIAGYGPEMLLISAVVALAKAAESLSDVCYGLLQRNERMDRIARSMIIRGVLSVVALAVLLQATQNLATAVSGIAAAWIAVLLLYDLPGTAPFVRRERGLQRIANPVNEQLARCGRLAAMALPLGAVMMLISLNANIPRFFVEGELGEASLGYYSAIVYVSIAATTVMNALGQAAVPQLALRFAQVEREPFVSLLLKLAAAALLLGIGGWALSSLIGAPLLAVIYTPEYAEYARLLTLTMAATTVSLIASALGYGMTAMRRFKIQLPIFALVASANVVTCAVLIPRIGLFGAVWALLASGVVQLLASACVVAHGLKHASR